MTINRRELLERVAYLIGGAISAPAALGVLQGCTPSSTSGSKPVFLTEPQLETVAAIAEIMIPRTDTPGAKDVGVPAFIDSMLKATYQDTDRERFVSGLNDFEALAQREHQSRFMRLSQADGLCPDAGDQALVRQRRRASVHRGEAFRLGSRLPRWRPLSDVGPAELSLERSGLRGQRKRRHRCRLAYPL